MRRAAWLLLASVTAVGVLFLFVFPGRTLLAQDRDISVAEQHITSLDRENAVLRARGASLNDPAEIEQIARQRFGLVLPGQSAFAVTAPPVTKRTVPKKRPAPAPSGTPHVGFWR